MTATTDIKKDPAVQGAHILRSYLTALNIPFESEAGTNRVAVFSKNGSRIDVTVTSGPGAIGMALDPEALSSYKMETSMRELHRITEVAGYGKPLPIDRGQKVDGRINYNDNFEDVYLRHSIFRRSPNRSEAELEPYMRTIKSVSKWAIFKWRSVFAAMGFGEADLVSVGMVYTTSFLHNYASAADTVDNIRLLTEFLKQRFGEMAKITHKKALNATCLPQAIRSETSSEDGEISFIEAFAESETSAPDEEYEEDEFILTYPDGSEKVLRVENDGSLGLDFFLDGYLIVNKDEESKLVNDIRDGVIQKRRREVAEATPDLPDNTKERKDAALDELNKRLASMSEEQRTVLLSYAALSRDYSPDARRMARRLADELVCPKCERRVPSGNMCIPCGVLAIPRFGVDYMAFKERLASEGHPMAEAMNAPIPESEVRARQKRPVVPVGVKALVESQSGDAPEIVSVNDAQELKAKHEAMVDQMAADLMAKLPEKIVCPKCKVEKHKTEFGIRVAKDKATGVPLRPSRQSYCSPCRKTKKS